MEGIIQRKLQRYRKDNRGSRRKVITEEKNTLSASECFKNSKGNPGIYLLLNIHNKMIHSKRPTVVKQHTPLCVFVCLLQNVYINSLPMNPLFSCFKFFPLLATTFRSGLAYLQQIHPKDL